MNISLSSMKKMMLLLLAMTLAQGDFFIYHEAGKGELLKNRLTKQNGIFFNIKNMEIMHLNAN